MKIYYDLDTYENAASDIALTIGNFDGVHRGHQAILSKLKEVMRPVQGATVVITFANHPLEVLKPELKLSFLCTLEHRLKLIEEAGIDDLILLTFTKEFSLQTAEEFLKKVRSKCPFIQLILGPDATMGKDRTGDKSSMLKLAATMKFDLTYLDKVVVENEKVSSSKIRELIKQGNLQAVGQMLGREYSLYVPVKSGQGLGKKIGFPTINCHVETLCVPPLGVYAVKVIQNGNILRGVANLGVAPTVRQDQIPLLEIHLLDPHEEIKDGSFMEVVFVQFIRPEIRFASIPELQTQISKDIRTAKQMLIGRLKLWPRMPS